MNSYTKGIATLWLIIAGFVLIAGGGVYWLGTKSPKPMSDLEWFVKDEERLNMIIKISSTTTWMIFSNCRMQKIGCS